MESIKVNFNNIIGQVKPMHAINNGPTFILNKPFWEEAKTAGIPYARMHDTSGPFGGSHFVDIPNVFPNFDADENDPNNYDFAFTDELFRYCADAGMKPYYRLGVTIENYQYVKAYNIYPPKDYHKWARICEHIIMHYNEGWAKGFHYDIEYWEIWNEPDNENEIDKNPMWKGTMEQFFELYEVASNYLKNRFPHLKIGGYGSCGFYAYTGDQSVSHANISTRNGYFIAFFEEFLKYISSEEHKSPLDFFTWHSYMANPYKNVQFQEFARQKLDEAGFTNTETMLNEWNPGIANRGKIIDASNILNMMIVMNNNSDVDMLMYYDGRPNSNYCGLWSYESGILKGYYAFLYFNAVYSLKNQVECVCSDDYVKTISAFKDGKGAIVLSNFGDDEKTIEISVQGANIADFECFETTADANNAKVEVKADNTMVVTLKPRAIMVVKN